MTEEMYLHSFNGMDCVSRVERITESGGIVLHGTTFYPGGGGQPPDTGVLEPWKSASGVLAIVRVHRDETGDIVHVPETTEHAAAPGDYFQCAPDAGRRWAHSRVHTLLHLLSVVLPFPVTGGQISEGYGRLDFDMAAAPEDPGAVEAALAALIAEDHPVSDEWITDAELAANPGLVKTMRVKPPVGQGRVRLVRIGTAERTVDLQPCGGTHVFRTGEIGKVRLGKIEKKGKENRRVYVHLAE